MRSKGGTQRGSRSPTLCGQGHRGAPGDAASLRERGRGRDLASGGTELDRKSTRLNSSHANMSYAVFCLNKNATKQWRMSPDLDPPAMIIDISSMYNTTLCARLFLPVT